MGDEEEELGRAPRNYGGFLNSRLGLINNGIWEQWKAYFEHELNNPADMNGSYLKIVIMMNLRGNIRKFTIEDYRGRLEVLAVECFILKCQFLSIGIEMRYKLKLKTYEHDQRGRHKGVQLKVKILKKEIIEMEKMGYNLFDNNIRF